MSNKHVPFPSASRYLDNIWNKKVHKDHEDRLRNVKATNRGQSKVFFDNHPPIASQYTHIYTRAKKKQAEGDRKCEINRQQNLLIEKIDNIFKQSNKEISTKCWSRWLDIAPGVKIGPSTIPIIDNQGHQGVKRRNEGVKWRNDARRRHWKQIEGENENIFRRIKQHEGFVFNESSPNRSKSALGLVSPPKKEKPRKLKQSKSPFNRVTHEKQFRQQEKYAQMLQLYPYQQNSAAKKTVLKKKTKVWLPEIVDTRPYQIGEAQGDSVLDRYINEEVQRPQSGPKELLGVPDPGQGLVTSMDEGLLGGEYHREDHLEPIMDNEMSSPIINQREQGLRQLYGVLQDEKNKVTRLEEEMSDMGLDEKNANLEDYLNQMQSLKSSGEDRIMNEIKNYQSGMARTIDSIAHN